VKKDNILYFTTIILAIFGSIMIYSSSYVWASYKFGNAFKYVINQGIFLIVGVVLMSLISRIKYKF